MQNLIMNSKWAPGPSGGPQYFAGVGPITYDKLLIDGYRTCSITMMDPGYAQDYYDVMINVQGKSTIFLKYTIRAVEANSISYVAEFANEMMMPITVAQKNITRDVSYNFKEVIAQFTVPQGAVAVRLSIKFMGIITACTYYAPMAYFG